MKDGSNFKTHAVQRRKKRNGPGFHVSDDIEMVSEIEVELSVTTVVDVDGGEIPGPSNDEISLSEKTGAIEKLNMLLILT